MSCQTMANEVIEMLREKARNSNCPDYSPDCSDYMQRVELALQQMEWDKALDLCKRGSAPCSDTSVDAEYCRAIGQMYSGAVYHSMGSLEEARNRYSQSAKIFSIMGRNDSEWCEATARYALGLLAQSSGDLYQAQRLCHRSHRLFQRLSKKGINVSSAEHLVRERVKFLDFLRWQRLKAIEQAESVPIIGATAAGEPILAIEVEPENVSPDRISLRGRNCKVKKLPEAGKSAAIELKSSSTYFALKVKGNSMTWVGIKDGDYVIFRQQHSADPGDIVVVRIDDPYGSSSTVKRFYRQDKTILLKAENPEYQPQIQVFGSDDPTIEILGKALAVASIARDNEL